MGLTRKSIGQLLRKTAIKYSARDALVHTELGLRYHYTLLSWEVERIARGLIQAGIQKEDRVAIWAGNIPEWVISFLALAAIGAVVVPIDPDAKEDDLQYILAQSTCGAIMLAENEETDGRLKNVFLMRDRIPTLEKIFLISDRPCQEVIGWQDLAVMGDKIEEDLFIKKMDAVQPEDPVAIMYTSGTTGKPKGAVIDHAGLINKSICSTDRQGINDTDRLCLFFPLFHMFGNTCIALAGLIKGAALIMPCKAYDPKRILKTIPKERCTAIYGSPSMLIGLVDHPEFRKKDWKSLTKGIIGGAPCPVDLMRRLVEEIGLSDITVAYGITEASSWITMTHPDDPVDLRVSTIGTPLACNEVRIIDPKSGNRLPPNEPGELCTRGFLMKGYYNMPAATAAAIDDENWFHTGDLGVMDEKGYVRITGRLKDVIVRDGIDIYPVEVEEVLYRLPEVSEVQVFGFPHAEKGQEVAAWIKVKKGSRLTRDALAAYARDHLDEKNRPHYFKMVSHFPMTASGKVQKFKLAALAEKEYGTK